VYRVELLGLLEAAPDAMVTVDAGGRIALVNTQAERLFGYPRAALLGRPVELLLPGGYPAASRPPVPGGGRALSGRRRDGDMFPVEVSLSPLATPGGTLVIGAIRDVTAREAAAAALREAAESFASLFAASEAICITEGGRIVAINPAYTALLGWEPAEVVGQLAVEVVVPADRAASAARLAAADERPYMVRLGCKDGRAVALEIIGRAIRYQGRPARSVGAEAARAADAPSQVRGHLRR